MPARRFAELAAQLNLVTDPRPVAKRPEDLKTRIEGFPPPLFTETSGDPTFFVGLKHYDNLGRTEVELAVPSSQSRIENITLAGGVKVNVRQKYDTVRSYEVPVRAFVRAAKRRLAQEKRIAVQVKSGELGGIFENPYAPSYLRDGLLALAKELQRRKDTRPYGRSGCTSIEM